MAFCTQCGFSNDEDARYCNQCGHELAPVKSLNGTGPKRRSTKWPWLLLMVFLALAAAGTVWHLQTVDFRITGDGQERTDSEETPDRKTSSSEEVPKKRPNAEDIQKKASKTADELFGSDQDVGILVAPVPLQKGLRDVETAASYQYARQDCDALFTDVAQQAAYSIQKDVTRVTAISTEEENRLGKEASRLVEKEYKGKLDMDNDWLAYVRSVGASLTSGVERKGIGYHFHIIRSGEENAFAVPGGGIYILTGLLNKIENEAQLAAILAHEIKHVDLRHVVAVYQVVSRLPDTVKNPAAIVAQMAKHPYSARQEADADRRGLELIYTFGYSPYQIVDFWEKKTVPAQQTSQNPSEQSPIGKIIETVVKEAENVLATHPKYEKRACLLRNHVIKLQEKYPMEKVYVGKWNYDNKVPMADAKM